MKLKTLKLINFKGLRNFELNADGANINIYGANAKGKTTIFDAVTWLLFDKNSENKADFGIKTRVDGVELSKAEHEVTATFITDNGEVSLRKVYHEQWTKPHGQLEEVLKGHTSEYYIDDTPKPANKYKEFIASLINEETFKLVTNPKYFNEKLDWKRRREIVMEICGNVTDGEVIEHDKSLAELPKLLGNKSIADFRATLKAQITKIKNDIEGIPARIAENQRTTTETNTLSKEELNKIISKLHGDIDEINLKIAELKAGSAKGELKKQILDLQNKLAESKAKATAKFQKEKQAKNAIVERLNAGYRELNNAVYSNDSDIKHVKDYIKECMAKRESLLKSFETESGKEFITCEIEHTCPTCGQELPTSKVEEAKTSLEKQKENFNLSKAENLQAIQEAGKSNNVKKDGLEEELKGLEEKHVEILKQIDTLNINLSKAKADSEAVVPLELSAEDEALQAEMSKLQADYNAPDLGLESTIAELTFKKESLQKLISDNQEQIAIIAANKVKEERIAELSKQEKELNAKYEELQKQLFMAETFERTRVELTMVKVNSKFKLARFNMFSQNLSNDGVTECCDTTFEGVPYNDLNNAARINIGLDIINTLTEYYKFNAPIFIDNAESVSNLIEVPQSQIIRLVVSEQDKTLRVEKENA